MYYMFWVHPSRPWPRLGAHSPYPEYRICTNSCAPKLPESALATHLQVLKTNAYRNVTLLESAPYEKHRGYGDWKSCKDFYQLSAEN